MTLMSSSIQPQKMKIRQISTLQQPKAKTVAGQMTSDTGSNASKVYTVSSKRLHHPQVAIISV